MSHTSKPEGNSSSAQSTQPSPDARVQVGVSGTELFPARLTREQCAEKLREAKADQDALPDQTGEHLAIKCACPAPGVEPYVKDAHRPGLVTCPVCGMAAVVPAVSPMMTGGAA